MRESWPTLKRVGKLETQGYDCEHSFCTEDRGPPKRGEGVYEDPVRKSRPNPRGKKPRKQGCKRGNSVSTEDNEP